MRLIIASDIHGAARACERLIEHVKAFEPDRLVLLGDILYHGPRNDLPDDSAPKRVIELLGPLAQIITCVRGNCEAEVDQMVLPFPCMETYHTLLDMDLRNTLFFTHGHVYGPGLHNSADNVPPLSPGDTLVYGHTHIKVHEPIPSRPDLMCFNPGSIGIPKDGSASFGIYEDGTFRHVPLF